MLEEMGQWMERAAGVLQVAILLKWSIDFSDIKEPVLEGEIQVYTYSAREKRMYRGPRVHEVLISRLTYVGVR